MARRATGRTELTWIIVIAGVLACAALLASVSSSGPPRRGPLLTAGTDFRLSSTVSNLTPGVSSSLVLPATNPYSVAISASFSAVITQVVRLSRPCITTTISGRYAVAPGRSICIMRPGPRLAR
jgi:hypothetical protein